MSPDPSTRTTDAICAVLDAAPHTPMSAEAIAIEGELDEQKVRNLMYYVVTKMKRARVVGKAGHENLYVAAQPPARIKGESEELTTVKITPAKAAAAAPAAAPVEAPPAQSPAAESAPAQEPAALQIPRFATVARREAGRIEREAKRTPKTARPALMVLDPSPHEVAVAPDGGLLVIQSDRVVLRVPANTTARLTEIHTALARVPA